MSAAAEKLDGQLSLARSDLDRLYGKQELALTKLQRLCAEESRI